jgi:hypothetical protein
MLRRLVVGVLAATGLLLAHVQPAAAQIYIDRWDLSAWGSAHTVLNGNQLVVHRFDPYGNGWYVNNDYYPWYCQVAAVIPGNAAGTPLRIRLYPPLGSGLACLSNAFDPLYGWATGTGYAEGQNVWVSACVEKSTFLIPFRDPGRLDSYGTEITVC